MPLKNQFESDIREEAKLGAYLDTLYPTIKALNNKFIFSRKSDLENQFLGTDLILTDKKTGRLISVDEKAQLHYKNKSLNTFTFEISYLKYGAWKKGWFYDDLKVTETYFLITSIIVDTRGLFQNCRLITINRAYLQGFLEENGLTEEKILEYEKLFRSDTKKYNGNQVISEIDSSFATFHCSFSNLREKPINLKIKLDALLKNNLGYEFLPCSIKGKKV